jgi:hypothetical protein
MKATSITAIELLHHLQGKCEFPYTTQRGTGKLRGLALQGLRVPMVPFLNRSHLSLKEGTPLLHHGVKLPFLHPRN